MNRTQRIKRLQTFIAEGRIIRNKWHSTDEAGREFACLLGALGSDIDDPDKCPVDVMPAWLAPITLGLDDNTSEKVWHDTIRRYGAAAVRWHILDDAAWRRVQVEVFLICLAVVSPYDKTGVVQSVIDLLTREKRGEVVTQNEWAAAWATSYATLAKLAQLSDAWWAVETATAAAVGSVVRAASAAGVTTVIATTELWAAGEARASAWDRIADALLSAIEAECTLRESINET